MSDDPVDLADPRLYDQGIPHGVFAQVRSMPGLAWNAANPAAGDASGFWAITRMADLVTVSRDHTTYSSELGHIQIYDIDDDVRRRRASLIDLDPPVHTQLRRLVSAVFTPRHVQRYESAIRDRVASSLDRLETDGGGDWVATVAKPIPIGAICDIMGVPAADHDLMIELSDHLVAGTSGSVLDPSAYGNTTPLRELPFNSPAAFGIADYASTARRRLLASPGDDLLSRLATVEIDGARLEVLDQPVQDGDPILEAVGRDERPRVRCIIAQCRGLVLIRQFDHFSETRAVTADGPGMRVADAPHQTPGAHRVFKGNVSLAAGADDRDIRRRISRLTDHVDRGLRVDEAGE